MNNPQILKIIENLKGRKNYEEKKASKLGFNSLYEYIENKMLKHKEAVKAEIAHKTEIQQDNKIEETRSIKKKSCSCC